MKFIGHQSTTDTDAIRCEIGLADRLRSGDGGLGKSSKSGHFAGRLSFLTLRAVHPVGRHPVRHEQVDPSVIVHIGEIDRPGPIRIGHAREVCRFEKPGACRGGGVQRCA